MKKLIQGLVDKCLLVTFGPHSSGLSGYFCAIHKHRTEGGHLPEYWNDCGHGHTMKEALLNAILVNDGGEACRSKNFERVI